MAASKLTCPECGKVMRPAKPLPAGKKVKCPDCGTAFAAEEDEIPKAAISKVAGKSGSKATTNAAAKAKAKTAPAKPPKKADDNPAPKAPETIGFKDDEDDGPATYSYVEGYSKDDEPEIEHGLDMSIKDLRGPAQAALIRPSNWIIFNGSLGFFGWLGLFILLLIPIVLPLPDEKKVDDIGALNVAGEEKPKKKSDERASFFMIASIDLMAITTLRWFVQIPMFFLIFLCMIYAGFAAFCGVKMQNLESRILGYIGSVMVMTPIATLGFVILVCAGITLVMGLIFDDGFIWFVVIVFTAFEWAGCIGIGIWGCVTLSSPKVVDGFNFVPE